MPTSFPARVKMSTSTTGTGSYTVTAVTAAGYRSLAQAAANGDITSGDTIHYIVIDTTVTNGTNLLEIGSGVWTSGTNQVTRASVYQPNNTAVTWGAGTRDFLVIDNPELFAILTGANFSGNVETTLKLISRFDNVQDRRCEFQSLSTWSAWNAYHRITNKLPLFIGNFNENVGVASGEGYIQFLLGTASVTVPGPKIRETGVMEGTFKTTSGTTPYDALPAGTKLLFGGTPPTGWTRVDATEDRMIKLAVAAESAGTAGGSWTVSGLTANGTTGGHALTADQIPNVGGETPFAGTVNYRMIDGSGATGNAHTHTLTSIPVASAGAWRPRYEIFIAATKN
jgi:hypothetical protein